MGVVWYRSNRTSGRIVLVERGYGIIFNMKNTRSGFMGIAVVIVVALVAIGGGIYFYSQKYEVKLGNSNGVSIETQTNSSPETTKEVVSPSTKILKVFTQSAGIYSASYPNYWTYSEGRLAARFETVKQGTSQTFDIDLGVDVDYVIKTLSLQYISEEITVGSNIFTKFTNPKYPSYIIYILPIGIVEGQSTYLLVRIEDFTKIDTTDLNQFLASIKVYPSKAIVIIKWQDNATADARIRANVVMMRPNAELYFVANNTYVGICDSINEKTRMAGIDKILNSVRKIVSVNDVKCNTSSDAYVYSVRMPSGDIACADSTGFGATISAEAKELSCK